MDMDGVVRTVMRHARTTHAPDRDWNWEQSAVPSPGLVTPPMGE
jgi:hypothetical protein